MFTHRFQLIRLLEGILAALFGAMTLAFFLQVVFRYVFELPLGWTEEITKLLFAWVSFLGTSIVFKQQGLTKIDIATARIPASWRFRMDLVIRLGISLVLMAILYFGTAIALMLRKESFITFDLSHVYLYAALPASCLIMLYYNITDMIDGIKKHRRDQEV